MKDAAPLAVRFHEPGGLDETLEFLKRTRNELRTLRKVRVWRDSLRVYDVNGDCFEVNGVGYGDNDIRFVLDAVHAVYRPESIHEAVERDFKEFKTGRRRPWAEDRVM